MAIAANPQSQAPPSTTRPESANQSTSPNTLTNTPNTAAPVVESAAPLPAAREIAKSKDAAKGAVSKLLSNIGGSATSGTIVPGAKGLEVYLSLPLGQLVPSETNPRKSFETEEDAELVESIKAHGVLVPLLVRTTFSQIGGPQKYEIVAGERRFRAANKAGLQTLPVRVVELSDAEALEVQIVENLQRKDVTALEESAGFVQLYASLQKQDAKAPKQQLIEQIAKKVGKSTRYVYARMKLDELVPEVKAQIASGKLSASHGDLISPLPPDEQKQVLEHCFEWGYDAEGKWGKDNETCSVGDLKYELRRMAYEKKRKAEQKEQQKVARAEVKKAPATPAKPVGPGPAALAKAKAEEKRRELEHDMRRAGSIAVFEAIVSKVKDVSGAVLDLLLAHAVECDDCGDESLVAKQVGWEIPEGHSYGQLQNLFRTKGAKLTGAEKAKLLVAIGLGVEVDWGTPQLDKVAVQFKLDVKKLRAGAAEKVKAAAKAAAEPKPEAKAADKPSTKPAAKKATKKAGRK